MKNRFSLIALALAAFACLGCADARNDLELWLGLRMASAPEVFEVPDPPPEPPPGRMTPPVAGEPVDGPPDDATIALSGLVLDLDRAPGPTQMAVRVDLEARRSPEPGERIFLETVCVDEERTVVARGTLFGGYVDAMDAGSVAHQTSTALRVSWSRAPQRCELSFALAGGRAKRIEALGTFCWRRHRFTPGRCVPQVEPERGRLEPGPTVTDLAIAPLGRSWSRGTLDVTAAVGLGELAIEQRDPHLVVACHQGDRRWVDTMALRLGGGVFDDRPGETIIHHRRFFQRTDAGLAEPPVRCDVRMVDAPILVVDEAPRVRTRWCYRDGEVRRGSCDGGEPPEWLCSWVSCDAPPLHQPRSDALAPEIWLDFRNTDDGLAGRVYADITALQPVVDTSISADVSCTAADARPWVEEDIYFSGGSLSLLEPGETLRMSGVLDDTLASTPTRCRVDLLAQIMTGGAPTVVLHTACFAGTTEIDC